MNLQNNMPQVLAWEWTETGFSFQYSSDGIITIERDHYLSSEAGNTPEQVKMPLANIDALKRLIQKIEAIKSGKVLAAPSLFIAS